MRDKYWHIQMHLPEGKEGSVIDSSLMLKESKPVIGTGEWDDKQCQDFKGIARKFRQRIKNKNGNKTAH